MTLLVAPATSDASGLAAAIAAREVSVSAVVESALRRIEELEPRIEAWAHVDAEGAREHARVLDDELAQGRVRGRLHGVPVGLKDVFHAAGMPTVANSKTTDPAARYADSGVAARLRAAGAVIVGKCETVEFAGMGDPPPTRNPWNTEHTAGGSSSGSGAAVGAGMVPVTIGTQTGGSNLRPAAYCGVAGFKPTHGVFSRAGLLPVSWTLDHPGIIARSARDLAVVFDVLARRPELRAVPGRPWRIGLVRQFFLEKSEPSVVTATQQAVARLAAAGAVIEEVSLPPMFAAQQSIHRLIMNPEMVTYHAGRLATDEARMSAKHILSTRAFQLVPAAYYIQALRARRILKEQLTALFEHVDVLAVPTAPGPAPRGLESTGDASLLSPWSLVGFPAATVPSGLSPDGLPLGLQLVGKANGDTTVLAAAIFAESVLGQLTLPY